MFIIGTFFFLKRLLGTFKCSLLGTFMAMDGMRFVLFDSDIKMTSKLKSIMFGTASKNFTFLQ